MSERNACSVHVDNFCGGSGLMENMMGLADTSQDLWHHLSKAAILRGLSLGNWILSRKRMFCGLLFLKHVKEKNSKLLSSGNVNQFKKCRIFMEGIVQDLEDMETQEWAQCEEQSLWNSALYFDNLWKNRSYICAYFSLVLFISLVHRFNIEKTQGSTKHCPLPAHQKSWLQAPIQENIL